ncbi:DUF4835 family protein [Membranicola marinus]|uniref:DUF4835 family protein n=1 Tax=Membranihabitans marinus TaxID=1227546 RepID=A0A953HKK1_9BACT|nr:DUF4835 family protein [Membranihabitans marinus]MBY5957594.1 DUF4835 family protein [Membranihabitans marinus]
MIKKVFVIGLCFLFIVLNTVNAQEFNVRVTVNFPTLQLADPAVFKTLESQLNEFFNGRAWTDQDLNDFEKIKGNINITITKEESATSFSGEMDVVISRPVYNSDYETTLINYRDKNIVFSYDPARPITYSENSFSDNLSATLAFYAYFILGMDGDSFALYGGDPYFNKAREISERIPASMQSEQTGWGRKGNSRNRYRMINEIFDPTMRPFRKAWYNYHRLGLDEMSKAPVVGREVMLDAMYSLQKVNDSEPNSMLVNVFFLAKALELNEVFAVSPRAEKIEAFNLIRSMDAANSQKYDKLVR